MNPIYKMCITNIASYLEKLKEEEREINGNFTAFQAAAVLSIAFAKKESDILNDIISINLK